MLSDRKHERKALSYPGWIVTSGPALVQCLIDDASDGGAKLMVRDPKGLPDRFMLKLSPIAKTARGCVVRWRKEDCVGVQFIGTSAGISERI